METFKRKQFGWTEVMETVNALLPLVRPEDLQKIRSSPEVQLAIAMLLRSEQYKLHGRPIIGECAPLELSQFVISLCSLTDRAYLLVRGTTAYLYSECPHSVSDPVEDAPKGSLLAGFKNLARVPLRDGRAMRCFVLCRYFHLEELDERIRWSDVEVTGLEVGEHVYCLTS